MKLCVTSGIVEKTYAGTPVPFAETVEFAKNAGFEEFDLGLKAGELLRDDWEYLLEQKALTVSDAGMKIRYVHIPYDYPKPEAAEEWERFSLATERAIKKINYLGADCAAIHPRSYMTTDYDEDVEYGEAYKFLAPYCELAHRENAVLAIEIMRGPGASAPSKMRRFGMDTDVLIELADKLDESICWDTGHANISLQKQRKSILKIGNRLKMVHVNDNFMEDDVHLAPFLGNINWSETISALKEIGYTGSMNLEVKCNKQPDELRPAYAAYMAECGKYLIRMFEK